MESIHNVLKVTVKNIDYLYRYENAWDKGKNVLIANTDTLLADLGTEKLN